MKEFITVYIGGICTGAPVWFLLGFAFSCWCFVKGYVAVDRVGRKKVSKWDPPDRT